MLKLLLILILIITDHALRKTEYIKVFKETITKI